MSIAKAKPAEKPVARKELTCETPYLYRLKLADGLTLQEVSLASEILRQFSGRGDLDESRLTQVDYLRRFIYAPNSDGYVYDLKLLLIPTRGYLIQCHHLQTVLTKLTETDWGLLETPEGFDSHRHVIAIVLDASDLTRYAKLGIRSNKIVGDIDWSGNRLPLPEASFAKVVPIKPVDIEEDDECFEYDEDFDEEDDDDDEIVVQSKKIVAPAKKAKPKCVIIEEDDDECFEDDEDDDDDEDTDW